MVDVGQFLGLRAAKRGGPPAAAQAGILDDSQPIPQPAVRFSAGQIAVLFVALAAIASIPILLYPWPPLSDYINHLARMHVIAAVGSDPDLALFYQIEWQYEPTSFDLDWDALGNVIQRFTPDFYLPVYDLYIEITTLNQKLVTKKNRKVRRLREMYPEVQCKIFYQRDYLSLVMKYGLEDGRQAG